MIYYLKNKFVLFQNDFLAINDIDTLDRFSIDTTPLSGLWGKIVYFTTTLRLFWMYTPLRVGILSSFTPSRV